MKSLFSCLIPFLSISTAFALTQNGDPLLSFGDMITMREQLNQIKAYEARNVKNAHNPVQGENVLVAVIDSGVTTNHPHLREKIFTNRREIPNNWTDDDNNGYTDDAYGWSFVQKSTFVEDEHGHGTHVAGIIAGEYGVAPKAQILPIKACLADGSCPTDNVVKAIKYAASMGARIANLSLIIHDESFGTRIKFIEVVKAAEKYGILLVTAAGNYSQDNDKFLIYPSAITSDHIITVCSVNKENYLSEFSHYGAKSVDLCAYGENILSLDWQWFSNNKLTATMSGTSMSAPFVTGVAALIASAKPSLKAPQIKAAIRNGSRIFATLKGYNATWGVLDAELAMKSALGKR